MNKEIKEILDKLQKVANRETASRNYLMEMRDKDYQLLLDYITNLQEKYDKSLELLADFNMPCEYDEGKMPNGYCEENCEVSDEIYKKCWNKYIELLQAEDKELKGE